MHLELNETEQHVVAAALERYRIAKSAEKMLHGQRAMKKDKAEGTAVFARYDALLGIVTGLQKRLQTPERAS